MVDHRRALDDVTAQLVAELEAVESENTQLAAQLAASRSAVGDRFAV